MRVTHATIDFEMPDGFVDSTAVSLERPVPLDKNGHPVPGAKGYPLSITVNRDVVGKAPAPLPYLQNKINQIRTQLEEFKLDYCKEEQVGPYKCAKAHFSFVSYFQLEQLVLVFFIGDALMTATLTTTEPGIEEGWAVLTKLVTELKLTDK